MSKIMELLARCAHSRHAALKNNGHAVLDTASRRIKQIAGQARNDAGVGL